jgi:hypothetical protein
MPCKKQSTAEHIANLFFQYVWVHFGLPTSIISNRDTRFLGDFWTSLWRMMDTKLKRRSAFHPQTDGRIEVVNRTDPKRIQRRLRITQNSQKQLRKLRMASTDREREKIQSLQSSVKLASSRRACHKISNDVNGSSNGVTDQKIFTVKVLVNLAQSAGMSQHPYC